MTERAVSPTPETRRKQQDAADPRATVWVSANAGSGKTHVLTRRVLRLLLTGVKPAEILCLTYTKAAAAEMRGRVTDHLGRWALLGDAPLGDELAELTGTVPDGEMRLRARTLFAHALDTPGGLKINTIHAFCESVLHRFPLEAGVPFGFTVIEDAERQRLIRMAREQAIATALDYGGPLASAVDILFDFLSDSALEKAVDAALTQMRKLKPVLADAAAAKARLRRFVGATEAADPPALRRSIAAATLLTGEDILLIRNELEPNPGGSRAIDVLAALADPAAPDADTLEKALFTAKGEPRQALLNKKQAETYPILNDTLRREQARLQALFAEIVGAELVARSEALIDLLAAIVGDYEGAKRARAGLDFDDLVTKTAALFGDPAQGIWVRYKLDAGITHILVDESQDTNPEQWQVIAALAEEFFAGMSAAERPRSLFAVGDPKQSIFSFQGAEPALFGEAGRAYGKKAEAAGRLFRRLPMRASFRTLPAVLEAVDLVFADETLKQAVVVGEDYVPHESARQHGGGLVALWPLVVAEKPGEEADPWSAPIAGYVPTNMARQLAERIATTIRDWIESGRALGPRRRPIRADDVLVLVQSRSALFHEIIRALAVNGLPSPGADRLDVGHHIAVRDLIALAEVLANPGDDLTLAALLRSPLFDVGEDDLFTLAEGRAGGLYQAMRNCPIPSVADAYRRLSAWRERLDFDRPYEFYADVLYAEGGLRRFHARLGGEVDDVLAEFLALALASENADEPSLLGFVAGMRSRRVEIKRELGEAVSGVRVMTIHGAKGLEAPIVILADAASKPQGSQTHRALYFESTGDGPFLFHASSERQQTAETLPVFRREKAAQTAEYWRKLYVGMTRAEDELHVAGLIAAKKTTDGTWYGALAAALAGRTAAAEIASGFASEVFPADAPVGARLERRAESPVAKAPSAPPVPVVLPRRPALLAPSRAFAGADPFEAGIEAFADAEAARQAGIALHALLQHLPGVAVEKRRDVAGAALASLLPADPARHQVLAETALGLVADPGLAAIFAPGSRPEVPILAQARRDGEKVIIAGRIDRLVIGPDRILIVDFKSDARPPASPQAIPPAYIAQLGLYRLVLGHIHPGIPVEAALLWTASRTLMPVPVAAMDGLAAGVVLC